MADIRTTPELDNFIRANENPLSGGGIWGELDTVNPGANLKNQTNAARGTLSIPDRFWCRYWTAGALSGDIELWVEIDSPLTGTDWAGLGLLTNAGQNGVNHQGYVAYIQDNNLSDIVSIYRYDTWDSGILVSGSTISAFQGANTLFLFRTNGTSVQSYYSNDGGANWTTLVDAVDNTYRASLYMIPAFVGMFGGETGYIGFGGGATGTLTASNQLPYLGVGP